jgi:serine/threonine-protein kinase
MSIVGPVSELLLRWEELRAQGRLASAEELCRDRPELLDEVRRHLRALEAVYRVPRGPDPQADTFHEADRPVSAGALPPGYELLEELGRGGMGVVYKARQVHLNRLVAVKMILAGDHASAHERARFKAEAESSARLSHPSIVQVHEVGEHQGRPYLILEYVDGESLARRTGGTPMLARQAAELVRTLAGAIHHAHERGVIHRDLKPANVLLQKNSTTDYTDRTDKEKTGPASSSYPCDPCNPWFSSSPKITDFGLAKRLDEQGQTRTGEVLGTPSYMAPEQAAGQSRAVGPHTDVYALGAILYELLTGRPPFKGATLMETLEQVLTQAPVPPSLLLPRLPRDLETICLKCLTKEPEGRYASAAALADDLDRFLAGESISVRSSSIVEQVTRMLGRSQYDARFHIWGTLLLWLALLPLLVHVPVFLLALAGRELVAAALTASLGCAATVVVALWLCWRGRHSTTGPAERLLWTILLGQLMALCLMAVASRPSSTAEALALYPRWAVLTGLTFFIMGGNFWGGCYALGLAFFALAVVLPFCPVAGPLALGGLMATALFVMGVRLRRVRRDHD